MTNKTLIFKKIPTGLPVPGEHLVVEDRPFDINAAPPSGGLVVEELWASFDPYLRGKMRGPNVKSYSPPFQLNEPITNDTISKVIKSDNRDFARGEIVIAHLPIAEYATISKELMPRVRKINNSHNLELGYFLGPLGMPGLTAFSSLFKIGKPSKGDTIFISSAAGAVGQVVGQIARREGLKVIGSVGSDDKLEFIIKELGFDGGFNYKKERSGDALARLAPDGIDIYYDNVGGEQLEAALTAMNAHGRIVVCGMISGYNQPANEQYGVKGLSQVVTKRIVIEGFLVSEIGPAYAGEHQEKVQQWLADGSMKAKLSVTEGINNGPNGLVGMLEGKNFGKAVLKIKDE